MLQAKIYKLYSDNSHYYYYGSTCLSLAKRLNCHKYDSQRYPNMYIYKMINEHIGADNLRIVLVEEPKDITNKQQLLVIEDKYIRDNLDDEYCLNINRALLTVEELKIQRKQYRIDNKEKIAIKKKQWYDLQYKKRKALLDKQQIY